MKKLMMDSSKLMKDNLIKIKEKNKDGICITHCVVDNKNEQLLKRIKGDYYSISFDYVLLHKKDKLIKKELQKILKNLLVDKMPKPLIIGLGNSSITCDSLGIHTTNKVMATNHFTDFLNLPKVALFNPEVTEKTGISSFDLIDMVVKKLRPTVIIIIDSLATNVEENLNNHIEINNTGIIPGSAIKDNKKIDANTFHIPIISIGVPLIYEKGHELYTSPTVHEIVGATSDIIAEALNDLFF